MHTEAGIVGDNEVEAIADAKWSRTDEIDIHIYTHIYRERDRLLYINISR